MSGQRHRSRLRLAGPVLVLGGLAAVAAWLGPVLRPPPREPWAGGDLSLLVLENLPDPDGAITRQRLVRVAVRAAGPAPAEPVWEGDATFFGHSPPPGVVADYYAVAPSGGVIDVRTGDVVHDPAGRVADVTDDHVVYRGRDGSDAPLVTFAYNPRTRLRTQLGGGRYGMPGVRSPNGDKWAEGRGRTLTIHYIQRGPATLGSEFHVGLNPHSSDPGTPPVLWLDDAHVLTQTGNGVLVSVATDRTRAPVVTIPARPDPLASPTLTRDRTGRIIYACGGDGFVIDPAARTWVRCEWVDLGHGFEAGWSAGADGHAVRYRGQVVGACHCRPHAKGTVVTTEGHLAAVVGSDGDRDGVRVWSAATGRWAAAGVAAPAALVGWVK